MKNMGVQHRFEKMKLQTMFFLKKTSPVIILSHQTYEYQSYTNRSKLKIYKENPTLLASHLTHQWHVIKAGGSVYEKKLG